MKHCNKCDEDKLAEAFYKSKYAKDGLFWFCRECMNEYTRKWRARNPEARRDEARARVYRQEYNLTLADYDLLEEYQEHVCGICGGVNKQTRLAVDHDHITGEVRGLLCLMCNTKLGWYEKYFSQIGRYLANPPARQVD